MKTLFLKTGDSPLVDGLAKSLSDNKYRNFS